jgi:hypothetical protein
MGYQAVDKLRLTPKCGVGRLRGIPRLILEARVSHALAKRRCNPCGCCAFRIGLRLAFRPDACLSTACYGDPGKDSGRHTDSRMDVSGFSFDPNPRPLMDDPEYGLRKRSFILFRVKENAIITQRAPDIPAISRSD